MKPRVRRARFRMVGGTVWLPWWMVTCECGYSTPSFWWSEAMRTANRHARLHSPTIRRVS